jgi:integrase/recombinase XerD
VRTIFRQAFVAAALPYFPPHSFGHTLGHFMQTVGRIPKQLKASSENLGHETIGANLASRARSNRTKKAILSSGYLTT